MTAKSYSDGTPSVSLSYDVSSETNPANTKNRLTYEQVQSGGSLLAKRSLVAYDPRGRVKNELQCTPSSCGGSQYSLQYQYDYLGNVIQSTNGSNVSPVVTLNYSYDSGDHLASVTSSWNSDSQHPGNLFGLQQSPYGYGPMGLTDATLGPGVVLHRDYNLRGQLYHESDQGNVVVLASSGSGTATINFSEQFQGTPGTGSLTVNGSEQSRQIQTAGATPGIGTVTISGSEQSVDWNPCQNQYPYYCPQTMYDSGAILVTVNGFNMSAGWSQGSNATSVASGLASGFNSNSSSPVTATASGNVVTLTAKATGAATNYALSASVQSWNTSFFSSPSFSPSTAGLSGGHDTQYTTSWDTGTVNAWVNGYLKQVNYDQNSSGSILASSLASAFANDGSSPVTASASGATVYFTSRQIGASTNYSLSASSSTGNGNFSSPSFTTSPSGSSLTGGTSNGISDAGTVTLTVNSFAKTVSYSSSDDATSIASNLAAAYSGDGSSPVNVSANGATLTMRAKQTGLGTNYAYSFATTYDTAHFSSPSYHGPSSGSLNGGADYSSTAGAIYSYTLGFYPNGNVASVNDSVLGTWNYGVSGVPGYDDMNRLKYASTNGGQCAGMNISWAYDRYGNRWSQSASGSSGCSIYQGSFSFSGGNNRIDGWSYDAAGNSLNDGTHSYTYDAEGRISSVDGATRYIYDAEGRRVAKENGSGAVTASYVLGLGGEQVSEFNGAGQWVHSNVYAGGKLLATYDSAGTRFHLTDALGSRRVQAHPDGTAGLFCFNYPFGDGLNCWGGDEDSTEHHFTGKERDSESGLDNFGARYNTSTMGRFMTPDPLGGHQEDPQTLNKYAYVRNNPLNLTDPTGLDWYLGCTSSEHSGCTQLNDKDKTWVQADKNGNATIVTSDSIRSGDNSATVDKNGVEVTTGGKTYQGVYFDNPASHTTDANGNDVNHNPITLQGDASKGFGGFTFNFNGNCGGTCLSSGSFQFAGTPQQARAALKAAGAWDYGIFDDIDGSNLPFFGHHPDSTQFRFGSGPSPHFSLPDLFLKTPMGAIYGNPKSTVPASGDFHVDSSTGFFSHGLCSNFGVGCSK